MPIIPVVKLLAIVLGLGLAGWGHLLVHDLLGAGAIWRRLDDRFPPGWRSEAPFGGALLLALGTLLVLAPVLG